MDSGAIHLMGSLPLEAETQSHIEVTVQMSLNLSGLLGFLLAKDNHLLPM